MLVFSIRYFSNYLEAWRLQSSSYATSTPHILNYYERSSLVPSRLRVTRVAGAGGDGKGKGRKSLSLAFLLPITPRAPLERDSERRLGTSQMRGEFNLKLEESELYLTPYEFLT